MDFSSVILNLFQDLSFTLMNDTPLGWRFSKRAGRRSELQIKLELENFFRILFAIGGFLSGKPYDSPE